jgi:hypothetical protein
MPSTTIGWYVVPAAVKSTPSAWIEVNGVVAEIYGWLSEGRLDLDRGGEFIIQMRFPSTAGFRVSLVSLEEGVQGPRATCLD